MRIGVHNNNHPFSTYKSCRTKLDLFETAAFKGNCCRECADRRKKASPTKPLEDFYYAIYMVEYHI